jgi:hypothetical protein
LRKDKNLVPFEKPTLQIEANSPKISAPPTSIGSDEVILAAINDAIAKLVVP